MTKTEFYARVRAAHDAGEDLHLSMDDLHDLPAIIGNVFTAVEAPAPAPGQIGLVHGVRVFEPGYEV